MRCFTRSGTAHCILQQLERGLLLPTPEKQAHTKETTTTNQQMLYAAAILYSTQEQQNPTNLFFTFQLACNQVDYDYTGLGSDFCGAFDTTSLSQHRAARASTVQRAWLEG